MPEVLKAYCRQLLAADDLVEAKAQRVRIQYFSRVVGPFENAIGIAKR
jgi:hypothetical protein